MGFLFLPGIEISRKKNFLGFSGFCARPRFSVISFFSLFSASRLSFPRFFNSTGCIFPRHVVRVVEWPVVFNLLKLFLCFLNFHENSQSGQILIFTRFFGCAKFFLSKTCTGQASSFLKTYGSLLLAFAIVLHSNSFFTNSSGLF